MPSTVRTLPAPRLAVRESHTTTTTSLQMGRPTEAPAIGATAPPPALVPLAPERYKLQITVSRDTHDTLRRVQALIRHTIPTGDPADIFDRALTLLLQDLERRRCATVTSPRAPRESANRSRQIPAAVKREVWRRDDGRCAYVGRNGRCEERGFLEYHHVQPYATGGAATTANIELRCRAHNQHEASLCVGQDAEHVDIPLGP